MDNLSYRAAYRRNLPHLQPQGATLFVTFRLVDSVPQVVQNQWREEKVVWERELNRLQEVSLRSQRLREWARRRFAELENALDRSTSGEHWLKHSELAQIVSDSLHFRDQKEYRLDAFCIMSNHVHLLIQPLPTEADDAFQPLQKIMHGLKRFTALKCNRYLHRTGSFWESESFDHYIRNDDEWMRVLHYILQNPVKAGIVTHWRDFPFTYCREDALPYVTI